MIRVFLVLLLAPVAAWGQVPPACDTTTGTGSALANAAANLGVKETCTLHDSAALLAMGSGTNPFASTAAERAALGEPSSPQGCEPNANSMTSFAGPGGWIRSDATPIGQGRVWIAGGEHGGYGTGAMYFEATDTWVNNRDGLSYPPTAAFGSRTCGTSSVITRAAIWENYGHTYGHSGYDSTRNWNIQRTYNSNSVWVWSAGASNNLDFYNATVTEFFLGAGCAYTGSDDVANVAEYFPDRDELVWYSGTGKTICAVDPDVGNTLNVVHLNMGTITGGNYHNIGVYVPGSPGYMLFGGGNQSNEFYIYRADGTASLAFNAPANWNIPYDFNTNATVMTSSPDGKAVFLLVNGEVREYDPVGGLSGNVSTSTTPNNYPTAYNYNTWYAHTQGYFISDYGVTMLVNGNGLTNPIVTLYRHAASTPPPDPREQDFAARCADPSVHVCFDFETQAQRDDYVFLDGSEGQVTLSTSNAYSGSRAIQFTQPTNSGTNAAGSWRTNWNGCGGFPDIPSRNACITAAGGPVEAAEGERFAVQYAYWLGPEHNSTFMYEHDGAGGQGQVASPKLGMTGYADQIDQLESGSCSNNEIVFQNTLSRGHLQAYHACGYYTPYERNCTGEPGCVGGSDLVMLQDEIYDDTHPSGNFRCLYGTGATPRGPPAATFPQNVDNFGPCVPLPVDTWHTYQMVVDVGTNITTSCPYGECFCGSRIRVYIQTNWGDASTLVADWPDTCLRRQTVESGWGKTWLLPYVSNKWSGQAHPDMRYRYDELIISSACIADPGTKALPLGCGAAPTPDPGVTLPPVDTNNQRAPYIRTVHRASDTVLANWQASAVQLPAACDVTLTAGTSMVDLENAWNDPANTAICIDPGVDLGTGAATFTRTSCAGRIFLLPSDFNQRAPSNYTYHPANAGGPPRVGQLQFNTTAACEHAVYRLALNDTAPANSVECAVGDVSTSIVLSHLKADGPMDLSNCSANAISVHYTEATTAPTAGVDRDCIALPPNVVDAWVSENGLRNCAGAGVKVGSAGTRQNGGFRIWYNDIESTNRTDCAGNVTAVADDPCHAGGSAIEILSGSATDDAANYVEAIGNRIRGYRVTDSLVGGAAGRRNSVFSVHGDAYSVILRDNAVWDSHGLFVAPTVGGLSSASGTRHSIVGSTAILKTFPITGVEAFCTAQGGAIECGAFNKGVDLRNTATSRLASNTIRFDTALGGTPEYLVSSTSASQIVSNAFIDGGIPAGTETGQIDCNAYDNATALADATTNYVGTWPRGSLSVGVDPIIGSQTVSLVDVTRADQAGASPIADLCAGVTIDINGYGNSGADGVSN